MSEENYPYIIVSGGLLEIEKRVAKRIEDGYVPLGGVQVVRAQPVGSLEPILTFYQTMVFNEV